MDALKPFSDVLVSLLPESDSGKIIWLIVFGLFVLIVTGRLKLEWIGQGILWIVQVVIRIAKHFWSQAQNRKERERIRRQQARDSREQQRIKRQYCSIGRHFFQGIEGIRTVTFTCRFCRIEKKFGEIEFDEDFEWCSYGLEGSGWGTLKDHDATKGS